MLGLVRWPFGLIRRRPVASVSVVVVLLLVAVPVGLHGWALYHFHQAELALDDDRLPEAREHIDCCKGVWPYSAPTHFLSARIDRMMGEYPHAEAELNECVKLQKGATAATQLEMLLVRAQRGEMDKVEPGLVYAYQHDSANARLILEGLARGHMNLMHYIPARYYLNECLQRDPDDVRALDWLGWVHEQLNDQDAALQDYQRALALAPGRSEVRLRLAIMYLGNNNPEQAETELARLPKTLSERPDVQISWARFHFLKGEFGEARKLLDRVLAARPDDDMALLYRGKLDLQEGRFEDAEVNFRAALEREPTNTEALFGLYNCLQKQPGREAEADAELETYNRLQKDGKRLTELLGGEFDMTGQKPEKAAEIGELYLRLGLDQLGQYWLYQALERNPRYERAHKDLAEYFEKTGDAERAAKHRRQMQ